MDEKNGLSSDIPGLLAELVENALLPSHVSFPSSRAPQDAINDDFLAGLEARFSSLTNQLNVADATSPSR